MVRIISYVDTLSDLHGSRTGHVDHDRNFVVSELLVWRETHSVRYMIREVPDGETRAAKLRMKEMFARKRNITEVEHAVTEVFGRQIEDARHSTDDEYVMKHLRSYIADGGEIYKPEEVLSKHPTTDPPFDRVPL
ncbi:MAG TPA: hypothetical protein VJH90_01020 [archaeon]|nr:hypothetical protein [archaeon]